MEFQFPESSERLRREARRLFRGPQVRAQVEAIRSRADGLDGDPRPLYGILGRAGLLAVAWPPAYGGRGGSPADLCAVIEEMARHDVPLALHYVTSHIVGRLLLLVGSEEQKRRLLPAMGRGELFACVLFTEPDAGSDLGALTTAARRVDRGWLLTGRKLFNSKTYLADYGLCVARSSAEASRYEGIGLFLVPLRSPGVRVRRLRSISEEGHFYDVELADVFVADEDVIGEVGQGWSLISQFFGGERSGLDYYARGLRWLELVREAMHASRGRPDPPVLEAFGRHGARLDASLWLALRVLGRLAAGQPDATQATLSKWHASESAQRIAWWALESLGPSATLREDGPGGLVAAAYCTAPGLTISGGASETLLDTLAVSQLDRLGGPGDLDPVQGDLACCVREALARKGCLWERLADLGLLGFGLPLEVGGLNLGSAAETVVGRELGQALEPLPGYRETAVAAAVLAIAGAPRDDIMAAVLAGRCRIAPIGLYGAPRLELDGRGRLQGCSDPLPDATWQAVVARARRPGGEALLFLPLPDSGCGVQPVETLAGPAVRLRFEAADRAVVLASAALDAVLERPLAAGRVRQAALLLGIAEAAIVAARDHAGRRRQFGRRLLDFQSVSHRLAGLAAELEGITLLVQEAGWRCDADRSPGPSSTQALAAAAELALAATRLAVQLHGARGMVVGGLAERAYRLAAVEAVRLGRPGALWREAGSRRYDSLPDL